MSNARTAIVTGGNAGIGRASVEKLLSLGHRCVVIDRTIQSFVTPKERVLWIKSDVSDKKETQAAVQAAIAWSGRIHYLVSSAGFAEVVPSVELEEDSWRRVMATNLDGTMYSNQILGRHMIDNGGGSIVNLGSVAGQFGWPHRLAYSCAKAGIEALTRTLAVEWAPHNIRVNTVIPSHVDTPLQQRLIDSGAVDLANIQSMNTMKRIADAGEIANAIVFLLSDEASFITGQSINVDGGFNILKTPIPTKSMSKNS